MPHAQKLGSLITIRLPDNNNRLSHLEEAKKLESSYKSSRECIIFSPEPFRNVCKDVMAMCRSFSYGFEIKPGWPQLHFLITKSA